MTDTTPPNTTPPKFGELNVGEQAKPPFAVLPDPQKLFKSRSSRFATLAPSHELEPYLRFLARLTAAQADAAATLPEATLPAANHIQQSLEHAMPPLGTLKVTGDAGFAAAVTAVLDKLGDADLPDATVTAIRSLRAATPEQLTALVSGLLSDVSADTDIAQRALVAAGLQVFFAKRASKLDVAALMPVADGACPSCGSAPVASAIVNWPRASNTRFCACSLCGTMWNVVRVKCVLCSATGGISYHTIEGKSDAVKAECCDACRAYVKIFNHGVDPALEPVADDVATLGLDMLMSEDGWKRGGRNPFLLGY